MFFLHQLKTRPRPTSLDGVVLAEVEVDGLLGLVLVLLVDEGPGVGTVGLEGRVLGDVRGEEVGLLLQRPERATRALERGCKNTFLLTRAQNVG